MFSNMQNTLAPIKGGKLIAMIAASWNSLLGPAATPATTLERLPLLHSKAAHGSWHQRAQGRDSIFVAQSGFEIIITSTGGPPPGDFRDWNRAGCQHAQRDRPPNTRLDQPGEFGAKCAFSCSAYAGYVNGQDLLGCALFSRGLLAETIQRPVWALNFSQ